MSPTGMSLDLRCVLFRVSRYMPDSFLLLSLLAFRFFVCFGFLYLVLRVHLCSFKFPFSFSLEGTRYSAREAQLD
jgi:hypothetical protein